MQTETAFKLRHRVQPLFKTGKNKQFINQTSISAVLCPFTVTLKWIFKEKQVYDIHVYTCMYMCFFFYICVYMCAFLCIHTHTYTLLKQVLFSAALHSFFSNTFWPMRLSSAFLWWLCLWKENNLQKPGAPCLCQSWNSDISAEVQVCGCYACLTISRKQTTGQIGKHERVLLCTVL